MCVTITPRAAAFMRRMVKFCDDPAGRGFRLVVSPGGCSGFASFFTIEAKPHPGDREFDAEGTPVYMPDSSCELLRGHVIDFADSATQTGLVFTGPAQSAGCGCGKGRATGLASVPVGNICRNPN
jgi:iron-sulfur cluster assembly accessory protein